MFVVIPAARGQARLGADLLAEARRIVQQSGLVGAQNFQARTFAGTSAVGALFTTTGAAGTGLGRHFCTASVVDSPHHDLVITAAHCVSRVTAPGEMTFVPGYHDGHAPYGVWDVTRVIVDRNWASSADPDDDFAFLAVSLPGKKAVEDVTGGERLGIGAAPGRTVQVVGYPDGAAAPIRCDNRLYRFSSSQLEFDCGGYTDGTSGSPFLTNVNRATGLGTVIGVIGGYEQGGYTPTVSYAARFGANVSALYKLAVSES